MATATARKVDDDHYKTLAESAQRNKRSISAELRDWIAEGARKRNATRLIAEMREIRALDHQNSPNSKTLSEILREERES